MSAVPGRALAAKGLLRLRQWENAVAALTESGPWETDLVCRGLRALALLKSGDKQGALRAAGANLEVDPLDTFARSVFWLAKDPAESKRLGDLIGGRAQSVLDLVAMYADLQQDEVALRLLEEFYLRRLPDEAWEAMPVYWARLLMARAPRNEAWSNLGEMVSKQSVSQVAPHRIESLAALKAAWARQPKDGKVALALGHLLFHLGRHAEGRQMWRHAADLGAEPGIAYRALGMASLVLDNDSEAAVKYLTRALEASPVDSIAARDLARILFSQADKAESADRKRELTERARALLLAAFEDGKGRSDFVALLASAQNRLGMFDATARLLDSVRITIWEGAHEAHDLFEEAHLAAGEAHLKAGRATEALAEFNRALEYPANLATGRPETTRDAHIHYLRGNALAALNLKTAALEAWKKAAEEPASGDAKKDAARQKAREAISKNQ